MMMNYAWRNLQGCTALNSTMGSNKLKLKSQYRARNINRLKLVQNQK